MSLLVVELNRVGGSPTNMTETHLIELVNDSALFKFG